MFGWFKEKKESKEKEKSISESSKPINEFSIEYYPETNRYYPKYKESYLRKDYNTGIMEKELPRFFMYSSYGKTKEEAERLIILYKEQQLKENVITYKL